MGILITDHLIGVAVFLNDHPYWNRWATAIEIDDLLIGVELYFFSVRSSVPMIIALI